MPKSYPPWPCMGIQHARNASPSFHSWGKNLLPCGRSRGASASRGAAAALFPSFGLTASANAGTTSFGNFGASGGVRPFAPFGRRRKPAARKKHGLFQGPCQKARAGVLQNLALFGRPAGLIRQTPPRALAGPKSLQRRSAWDKSGEMAQKCDAGRS